MSNMVCPNLAKWVKYALRSLKIIVHHCNQLPYAFFMCVFPAKFQLVKSSVTVKVLI